MIINIHGKDVDVSKKTIALIEEKLDFLGKYLLISDEDVANVIIKDAKKRIKLEITIDTKVGYLRAEVTDIDLKCALDEAVERLESQLITQKNRLNRRHRDKLALSFITDDVEEKKDSKEIPVRTKTISAQQMNLDDAILRMEMLGHSFFIYTDDESELLSVVYQRLDGGYGLIEVE